MDLEEEEVVPFSNEVKLINELEAEEEDDEDPGILDLSGHDLEKLSRAHKECALTTTTLLLDNNALQRLDNIHTYQCLEKLSVQNNRLARIFQVGKLCHLKILNLANNSIVAMEGFKELKLLSWLSLASNKIKTIESLTQNVHLEHLDLSGNNIPHISDLSYLRNLKTLLLHENRIGTLRLCDRHLPSGLSTLTLNDNQLMDLTDASNLSNLSDLVQLTLANNPCIFQPEDLSKQFDYRPFVINWCLNVQVLDGIPVGAKESLKAEWMYSQSKGRHFAVGQHKELCEYLLSICPLHPDENWEEDKKLNLILSKVQEHQESLRKDPAESLNLGNHSPRSNTLPRSSTLKSPRTNLFANKLPRRNSDASRTGGLCSSSSVENFKRTGSISSLSRSNVRSNPRSSPSPMRKSVGGHSTSQMNLCSYPVVLPRKLYDNNQNLNIMTQSLRFPSNNLNYHSMIGNIEKNNDLMTTSLDPSLLENIICNDTMGNSYTKNMNDSLNRHQNSNQGISDTWMKQRNGDNNGYIHRPDILFNNSEVDQTQSLIYPRLQSKLNTLPESLNSPDVPVPMNFSGKDDPLLSYGMRDSMYQEKADKIGCAQSITKSVDSRNERNKLNEEKKLEHKENENLTSMGQEKTIKEEAATKNIPSETEIVTETRVSPLSSSSLPVADSKPFESLPIKIDKSTYSDEGSHHRDLEGKKKNNISQKKANSVQSNPKREINKSRGQEPANAKTTKRKVIPRSQSSRHISSEPLLSKSSLSESLYSKNVRNTNRSSSARSTNVTRTDNGTKGGGRSMSRSSSVSTRQSKSIETEKKERKVRELKDEAKNIRGDDHIKFLTKELQSTKDALEKERKLRALQLDAIQVLWKEVQLMDATRGNPDKPRPSGSNGSKISNRSSEHSIAKLMDTLETISSSNYCFHKTESTLNPNPGTEDTEAVRTLNATCSNLQSQVEQLQGSLRGIVKFMSTFTNVNLDHTRPSSSVSQPDGSFASYPNLENSFENNAQLRSIFNSLEDPTFKSTLKTMPLNSSFNNPPSTSSLASSTCLSQSGDCLSHDENQSSFSHKNKALGPNKGNNNKIRTSSTCVRPTSLVIKNVKEPSMKKLMYTNSKSYSESSSQAPSSVKEFAEDLVDDVLTGTMISLPCSMKSVQSDVTDISLSLQDDTLDSSTEKGPNGSKCTSNFNDTPTPTDRVNSLNSDEHSSQIDTDSLE
ncbi:uncharacterized protein Cep97 isoform X2 [Lepeophtheirus salmonis]|uniref:uncharacterized protein Cep97 isoform X2 n=2 Tax=Lepeophtheirus salmonis TaxID=72036 RepID=UPI001AE579B4|nr:uncharacterized protein LOC121121758 isoform X2 [Lepeophtheirus salmonis]